MNKGALWAIIFLLAYALFVMLINVALSRPAHAAANGMSLPAQPRGFAGEGHAANHAHYDGLRNPAGMSCCNGQDCRPTEARQTADGSWQIMVNGEWRSDFIGGQVLDDAWLRLEQARLRQPIEGRWDTQAHVCASVAGKHPTIYCVILNSVWN